jgi:hypothetical protein
MIDTDSKGRKGKKKELKLVAVRLTNKPFIVCLVQKMQEFIIYRDSASISTE